MLWLTAVCVSHSLANTPFRAAHAPLEIAKSNHLGVGVDIVDMRQDSASVIVATLMMPRLRVAGVSDGDCRSASLEVARIVTSNVGKTVGILLFGLSNQRRRLRGP